ncbi:Hypothetical protein R9X50_00299900 [Acrodontium crateriforme]|uniref:Signal recognition particle subunit SRP14 n=1 Tax=Acrodontium crateriforme TaxID=150365 RepID=A0AAQ3M5E2_9PEZI|nr:Hypothetical protein R9X50_00299900 [Acrodontium crateriforme]
MANPHKSNDEFFTQLASLIEHTQKKGHGAIHLSQKRLTYKTDAAPTPEKIANNPEWDLNIADPLPLLVRATDGKSQSQDRKKNPNKNKLSTIVQPDDIEAFYARYAEVCKAGMQSLKKRDRSKRNKKKKKTPGTVEEKKA